MKNTTILTLVVSILLSFQSQAWALDLPEGSYKFKGEIEAISHKITEIVYSQTPAGKRRISELKSEGYTCQYVVQMKVSCSKFSKDLFVPSNLLQRLMEKYENYEINFDSEKTADLVNEAEYLTEYTVLQKVSTSELNSDRYNLSLLKGGLHKMKIDFNEQQTHYFNYTASDSLQIVQAFKETQGLVTNMYLVEIILNK